MGYAILRTAKLKKGDVAAMAHHHDRSRETLNADPEKELENRTMAGVVSSEIPAVINKRIDDIEKKTGKKTRKDAVAAIEVLMTASPEFFKDKEEWQIRVWSERSTEWAKKHFGKENVVSAVLHRDETSPHVHLVVFPETPDHKLSAKHWLDGVEKMQAMQDGYAEAVKIDGLERGIRGSKAKHMDIKRWYAVGLPKAREQVKELTERALAIGANIEKSLEKQFNAFAQMFEPKDKQQEQQRERSKAIELEAERKALEVLRQIDERKDRENDRGMTR